MRVKARAKEDRVEKVGEGQYKAWIKAVPEQGKANKAVIKLLSLHLGLSRSNIFLVSGQTSTQKVFKIIGQDPEGD